MSTQSITAPTRTERLDELPFNGRHRRLLGASGIGWALDAMDVGLISFVIAALGQQWGLDGQTKSWIISAGFLGMALGASLGGLLADRIGRRAVFSLTLLVYGLATGASALVASVGALLVLRFIVGLGLGSELPVASTLVSEFAPRRIRGRVVVWLEAFWALGWIAAAVIGYFVVAASDSGWRWALALGAVPALYALVVRFGLPESVRFLESRGRHDEAERVVRDFETDGGRRCAPEPGESGPRAAEARAAGSRAAEAQDPAAEGQPTSIFAPGLRRRTLALWTVWFCINLAYYGAFTWIPSLLVEQGYSLVRSFGFTLIITLAQLPGYAMAAWLIEVLGRRVTLVIFLAGSAASAIGFGLAGSEAAVIAAGCCLSFFNLGAWGTLYAIGPELYPTSVRGTGTGLAAGVGRIASILAPLTVPVMFAAGGMPVVFGVFSAAFAVAAIAGLLLPEMKGRLIG
ncbi:MFS transporter [Kocuria palustris]|uniref:MFS transporter n=1 Tax=Kocuria palustris TaxID=71999 RepID=UPI0011A9083E|nr:MFS transporter [Kocuria palustris]